MKARLWQAPFRPAAGTGAAAVSYTHLDVYKRQGERLAGVVQTAAVALGAVLSVALGLSLIHI